MSAIARDRVFSPRLREQSATTAADAYNDVGDNYLAYADGDPRQIYAFAGNYAYGDRRLWTVLDARLQQLRSSGADSIRILDAGCGPGTWIRRLVIRARALGFTQIRARGFDVAEGQILRARQLARDLRALPGVDLEFEVADITRPFPEADADVDISLCLYGVLNHIGSAALPGVIREIARVTSGYFITTVRAAGSTPTIYVDSVQQARAIRQDHAAERLEVDLHDGRRMTFHSRLFSSDELRTLVRAHLDVDELRGLDLFHTRFAPDPRWNPEWLPESGPFRDELARLEEVYGAAPEFIDRAAHVLLVARARRVADRHH